MTIRNLLTIIILNLVLVFCGCKSGKQKNNFSLKTPDAITKIKLGTSITLQLVNTKNLTVDSVSYTLNSKNIGHTLGGANFKKTFQNELLGNQIIKATVYYEGKTEQLTKKLTFVNATPPKLYHYEIIASYPHDRKAFTQGLEFIGDTLYESTGRNGQSSLRKVDYKTGTVLQQTDVDDNYFAEGITAVNGTILQLTWKGKEGLVYDAKTLKKIGNFAYNQSKEGWGLCNNGTQIYKSDGSEKIWILNPSTYAEESFIQITTNKGVKTRFNELEWVDGKIYANTWQKDGIAIINPKNGALEGVINLSGLREQVTDHDDLDVLNGIAYKADTQQLFVTGKNWDKLFEIKIVE